MTLYIYNSTSKIEHDDRLNETDCVRLLCYRASYNVQFIGKVSLGQVGH